MLNVVLIKQQFDIDQKKRFFDQQKQFFSCWVETKDWKIKMGKSVCFEYKRGRGGVGINKC